MTWLAAILAGVGSAGGALARYAVGRAIAKVNNSEFPWGTWIINMLGTLLLGLFFQFFDVWHHNLNLWILFGAGFCGGFTTFSTMSMETVQLFQTRRMMAILYVGSSLALGIILAWMTRWWM